ncbi:MAG: hypothetical protein E7513_00570 [Ruminococcaceae bacterium]|nr:hypothetical protein [Oscillospiraceae bacterium]
MENKEELTQANVSEEIAETEAQTQPKAETTTQTDTQPQTEATTEYTPQFSDIEEAVEESTEEVVEAKPSKKKFPLYIPVIIAACIVVLALVGYFAVSLFVPTIEGTWKYVSEEDQLEFYYTFDETAEGAMCEMNIGTIHFPGTYELSEADTTKTVSISVYAGYIYGNYAYEVEGNKLFGERVLTLTGEDGSTITLTQAKQPKDSDYIVPDENFEEVEALTGEWEYYYPEYDAAMKLTINSDGTMIYDQFGYQELHCVYTADDSVIKLSFFETEIIAQEEEYYFDNDQLIFLGLNWTRVGDTTPDQA